MSRTVTLPSGATAVLREADDLTYGDREDLFVTIRSDPKEKATPFGQTINTFFRAMMSVGVESWTVTARDGTPLPLPSEDPDVVRSLSVKDGAYLGEEVKALQKDLFPDFDVAPTGSPTTP